MLERMTEENNRRKYELERKMCKIPKEHCEDCQNMPAGDEETETELGRKMMRTEAEMESTNDEEFEGRGYVGTREAIFFLYYFYQQVTQGYLDMIAIDIDVQKEDLEPATEQENQRWANRIFFNLRASLANFMNDFAGVKLAL